MYPTGIGTHNMRTGSYTPAGVPEYSAVPPPVVRCFTHYLRAAGYYCSNDAKTDYQFKALALGIRSRGVLAIGDPLESASLRMQIGQFLRTPEEIEKNYDFIFLSIKNVRNEKETTTVMQNVICTTYKLRHK